jgi:hypothetical protein
VAPADKRGAGVSCIVASAARGAAPADSAARGAAPADKRGAGVSCIVASAARGAAPADKRGAGVSGRALGAPIGDTATTACRSKFSTFFPCASCG